MHITRPLTIIAAAAALVLALTSCGQEDASQQKSSPLDRWTESPLTPYLSGGWDPDQTQEEAQAREDERQRQTEELTAVCMQKEGFEYTPFLQSSTIYISEAGEWDPESRDWVARYGYGILDWPGREEQEQLMNQPPPSQAPEQIVNPNQDYMNSLSESERAAYQEALWGESPTEEQANDPDFDWDSLDRGCSGEAFDEINGQNLWEDDRFKEMTEALEAFHTTLEGLPEVAALDAEWASCMADAGQPGFTKQAHARESIVTEWNRLQGYVETEDGGMVATGSPSPVDEDTGMPESGVDPYDTPEAKALAGKEIELALADLGCRVETDYTDRKLDIQFAQEQAFVDAHKAELEAFKAESER